MLKLKKGFINLVMLLVLITGVNAIGNQAFACSDHTFYIEPGKSFVFKNIYEGTTDLPSVYVGGGSKFDSVIYKPTGANSYLNYEVDKDLTHKINPSKGDELVVTNTGENGISVLVDPGIIGEPSEQPAFAKTTILPQETKEFINVHPFTISIQSFLPQTGQYYYVLKNTEANTVSNEKTVIANTLHNIAAGQKSIITNTGQNNVQILVPYRLYQQ
ncbi:hypothetical protein [Aneurinibacillus tyrosinisolvens]|uniref:hypothetical protein n=1 Tax=Aneurinibacillus tyrosinisolvens TaxID=1443435 RepID=UPI00063FD02F|nr:hypothetical protein [Aneurinibacillus tyrosinisolvens]